MDKDAFQQPSGASKAIARNIDAIVKLEERAVSSRTTADRIADWIGGFSGSLTFVALHLVIYGLWIILNLGWLGGIKPFDPFPFLLLSVVVSIEAIFLSTFVLMKQNRMSRRADQRAQLDLQINLLAEREMTMVLRLLQHISKKLGAPLTSEELKELCEETSIENLFHQLTEKMPGE